MHVPHIWECKEYRLCFMLSNIKTPPSQAIARLSSIYLLEFYNITVLLLLKIFSMMNWKCDSVIGGKYLTITLFETVRVGLAYLPCLWQTTNCNITKPHHYGEEAIQILIFFTAEKLWNQLFFFVCFIWV